MKRISTQNLIALTPLALLALSSQIPTAFGQGTAFTYQGQLQDSGNLANGIYDFRFRLASDPLANNYVGADVFTNGVPVDGGLFNVVLDFGDGIFTGSNLWLEVSVRTNNVGGYTVLDPLQAVTPSPYAIAAGAAGRLTFGLSVQDNTNGSPNLIAGSSVNSVSNGAVGAAIGGGGTTNYLGFLDLPNQVQADFGTVSGGLANTIQPSAQYAAVGGGFGNIASGSAATVGGGSNNHSDGDYATLSGGYRGDASGQYATVSGGSGGLASAANSTVGGGEFNFATGQYATVGGGQWNQAANNAATVGGGASNIATNANATVSGGSQNTAGGSGSTVGGGSGNIASGSVSTVGGGSDNTASNTTATVSGGTLNTAGGLHATVSGGTLNTAVGSDSTVAGGGQNQASGDNSAVSGGYLNIASGSQATVPGGLGNVASGANSFAAGRQAKAIHDGTFVWAGSSTPADTDFVSTGTDQFLIRAAGGVGIGTASPSKALEVQSSGDTQIGIKSTDAGGHLWTIQSSAVSGDVNRDASFQIIDRTLNVSRLLIATNGNIGIRTTAPAVPLHVAGGTDAAVGGGGYIVAGPVNGANLVIDENEIMARDNGTTNTLLLNNNGGHVRVGGALGIQRTPVANALEVGGDASKTVAGNWLANSDARIKTDIHTVTGALDKLAQVRLVQFRYTDEYRTEHPSIEDRPYVNVIAQEFANVFPEAVRRGGDQLPDGEPILQVDTYPLTIYSAAAIQELNGKVESGRQKAETRMQKLEAENAQLRQSVTELRALVSTLALQLHKGAQ